MRVQFSEVNIKQNVNYDELGGKLVEGGGETETGLNDL